MIIIKHRRTRPGSLEKQYPGAVIVDVTSKSDSEFVKFSPFYPHRDIPVPFSPGWKATCVEAIWQGLKVFEQAGVDTTILYNATMKGLKRSVRKYGRVLGHRRGVGGSSHQLLDYVSARKYIYAPSYLWVLENKLGPLVDRLKELSSERTVVLLDYTTNADIEDTKSPLSHASLIKAYIEGHYPRFTAEEASPLFQIGQWVVHESCGPGEIIEVDGSRTGVRFGTQIRYFDSHGNALKPIEPAKPYTLPVRSHGENATLCLNGAGRWGVVGNPAKIQAEIPCEYEEIRFYAARLVARQKNPTFYFLVKKDGLWGILNKQGKQQAPCIYDELEPQEKDGYFEGFAFRRGTQTGLINGKGEQI